VSKKDPYNSLQKKRRWKHPIIDRIRGFFVSLLHKCKWDKSQETLKEEEPETFIQGLMRINSEVKGKANYQSNIKELVPHKMYKAKDLLAEIRSQKEILLKSDLKRFK
jgi:hypothetical protein